MLYLFLSYLSFNQHEADNNQETFIPNCFGTPTDLKPPYEGTQLAQINIVQQAFKERRAK